MTEVFGPPTQVSPTTTAAGYAIRRTVPDELVRHDISDEELDMLCNGGADRAYNAMWAFFGIAGGAISGALGAISRFLAKQPLALGELTALILLCVGLCLGTTLAIVCWGRGGSSKKIRIQIRSRSQAV